MITPALVTEATGLEATAATVDGALAGLHQYGLLSAPRTGGEPAELPVGHVALHPLVREVTAHTLSTTQPNPTGAWLTVLNQHLTQAVTDTVSIPGRAGWLTARLLARHLPELLSRASPQDFITARNTLDTLASTLSDAGAAAEELLLRRHVLDAETRHLGIDHPDTLTSRNSLANVLGDLGEYQQAADLYRQNLTDRERILGTDHPDTLTSRSNLATALGDLGEYQQAADLYRQNLADTERILGTDHPDTLLSRNNLAEAEAGLAHASARRRRMPWRR
ncbi:tetratricopeptide repeat protein [Streptomyces sp. NRRL S-1824]|uniref:tetratricopeptide repeat protein n=1 Tax=Streptomyces sp. NRRL S-1824 TaxID=1463889 RepID=UPI0006903EF4|nr:tetratricopeptide repeat protein [Streptomyces sp. NRRL S-1824]